MTHETGTGPVDREGPTKLISQGAVRSGIKPRNVNNQTSRCSSGVEHFLGKEEVVSSILINGSSIFENKIK